MSRKKEEAKPEKRTRLLGRPGNNVGIGIVGLPNVGKSSLFNCLSKLDVPAENYAFCTREPNRARVPVPDARFDHIVETYKPKNVVPAVLTVVDIAGLVKGAHEGVGIGNAFLSNIIAVDAIFHVTRAFRDVKIEHVEGTIDPIRDLSIIADELRLKDLEIVERLAGPLRRSAKADKNKKLELDTLEKAATILKEGGQIRHFDWAAKEISVLAHLCLLTAKPVIYLVNISEHDMLRLKNKWLGKIKQWINENDKGAVCVPFSASFEKKLSELEGEERAKYLAEGSCSMLDRIICLGYEALELSHFFTAGEKEAKCWTIRKGTKAPQAAGVIHTDFEKGFIAAECMHYKDFKEYGNEHDTKAAGKQNTKGKEYVVQDGDIMFFKFNAGGKKKKKK